MSMQHPMDILRRVVSRLISLVLLAGLALQAPPALADQLSTIRSQGRIRIAIAGNVPPFNAVDASGRLVGSDIETAELLANDLRVKLEIVRINNSERVGILLDRHADLVISALSITPQREREIAFSVPYARIETVIAAPESYNLTSMLDLNGRTVGALARSSNLSHLLLTAPGAKVVEYAENDKLSAGYLAGEFDIMTAPESVMRATNALKPTRPLKLQFRQTEFDIAIGMAHGEKNLRDWVNAWVVANLRNGKLADIYRRHHGSRLPAGILPSSEPNRRP